MQPDRETTRHHRSEPTRAFTFREDLSDLGLIVSRLLFGQSDYTLHKALSTCGNTLQRYI